MPTIVHERDVQKWPKMAQVVNQAAQELRMQYGDDIPADAIMRNCERIGGYRRDSVLPSDYCYNVINKAEFSFQYLVLVRMGRGRYRYVGSGAHYYGAVMWKPNQEAERQVGEWTDGECTLDFDPRHP